MKIKKCVIELGTETNGFEIETRKRGREGNKDKCEKNKQLYHCREWQMKGSLGINISHVFFQILLDYPFCFVHDLMCDKDLKQIFFFF